MKVSELITALEEFQAKLFEHQNLWTPSYFDVIPEELLKEQTRWLSRKLGALRPYIERYDPKATWDVLEAATGSTQRLIKKEPAITSTIQKLDQIIGKLQTYDQDEEIPADPSKPMRLGLTPDHIMLVYLDDLHPFIARGCSQLYRDEHYAQAVEEAAKAVFQYIRDVTNLTGDGAPLVQTAFSPKIPFWRLVILPMRRRKTSRSVLWKCFALLQRGCVTP